MSILEIPGSAVLYDRVVRRINPLPRRKLRVLLVSHTCQSRTEGQPKAELLGQMPDIDLRVLTPHRWFHYGHWRAAEAAEQGASFDLHVGRVRWPWVGPAKFYLHWYPELRQILTEFRPDVIDLWEEPWGLVSAQACLLRNRCLPGAKIVTETEQNINKKLPFPFERFRSYTLANADFAVGRNAEAIGVLRAKGYGGQAMVVPNAVDPQLFRPMDAESLRAEFGFSGFVVGYVGRLVEEKGILDLLDAVRQCGPNVNLVIAGAGPLEAELPARIASLGLQSRVRLLGALPQHELGKVMNCFDVLAIPSRTMPQWKEQFGRVIIEAHACGVPVIGSDSGAIPKVVGDGGAIVPEGDSRALSEAIRWLQANPQHTRELGQDGRRQVERHYTWRSVAEQMADIYRQVVAEDREASRANEPESVLRTGT